MAENPFTQEAIEEAIAEKLAAFIYDAYEDSAVEKGFTDRRGNKWVDIPEDIPHRILLVDAFRKLLRSDFMKYTENVDAEKVDEFVVFQGGADGNGDS